jgi:LPS sulfotransferase NodH
MNEPHPAPEPWPRGDGYADPLNDLPPFAGEPRNYIVACSQRCGSTLLCDLLGRTGRLGVPAEYLNFEWLGAQMAQRFGLPPTQTGLPLQKYLRELYRCRTSPEGFFGLKLQWFQYAPVAASKDVARLLRSSRIIWLTRRDLMAEAVSGSIAMTAGQWHHRPHKPRPETKVKYDVRHVDRALRWILWENFMWERFFRTNALAPLAVSYEDLLADTDGVCRRICLHIGLEDPPHFDLRDAATVPSPPGQSARWRKKYEQLLQLPPAAPDDSPSDPPDE